MMISRNEVIQYAMVDLNIDDEEATPKELQSVGCTAAFILFGFIAALGLIVFLFLWS